MQGIDKILVLKSERKIPSVDHCSYCNSAASSIFFHFCFTCRAFGATYVL